MNEQELYAKLQEAKYDLQNALEIIKDTDSQLGSENDMTFIQEIKPIIDEVFPNWEDI